MATEMTSFGWSRRVMVFSMGDVTLIQSRALMMYLINDYDTLHYFELPRLHQFSVLVILGRQSLSGIGYIQQFW